MGAVVKYPQNTSNSAASSSVTQYAVVSLGTDQSGINAGDRITFSSIESQNTSSTISLDTTTNVGVFTLPAGTYRFQAALFPTTNVTYFQWQKNDSGGDAAIGTIGTAEPSSGNRRQTPAVAIATFTEETTVWLEAVAGGSNSTVAGNRSHCDIISL